VLTSDEVVALAWVEEAGHAVTSARELTGGWTSTMLALSTDSGEDLVLRLMTREPWRSHGVALTTRESQVQQMLAATSVASPLSLALDAEGRACGVPAHLMTLVPGRVELDRVDEASLDLLAGVLATIHEVVPTIDLRTYQSWAWEAKYAVPPWASEPDLWETAFALLRSDPPDVEPCLIHRDFQPRNVLWSGDRVTGVVDWVETSIGPAWLDVAHCGTNLALRHGTDIADAYAAAYVARTGAVPEPYLEVMDLVGFLPLPGTRGFVEAADERRRLEERLRSVLLRLAGEGLRRQETLLADSRSRNQMVAALPCTPAAGISWTSGGVAARTRPTASALPSPLATNHTSSDRLSAAKVRLTRSGGGLGESVTATAISSPRSSCGKPGNNDATCPSGPTPSIVRWNRPATTDRTTSEYDAAAASTEAASAVDGISWIRAGSTPTTSSNAARAWPALRSGESGATNRSSPQKKSMRDQSTSLSGASRAISRWMASAMVPPVSATCGTSPVAWQFATSRTKAPATEVASSSADSCTSTRGDG
jgi:aminoglycoside phosphotransferase (APT) family kinase protein